MKLLMHTLALCTVSACSLLSQPYGARSMGMGGISGCLTDSWAVVNNIAGLAEIENPTASVSYHAIPSFKPFNQMSAIFALPLTKGVMGISASRFGDNLYNEHTFSFGFSNRFGLASLGIKGNYIQHRAEGSETRNAFTLSFGGLAFLTPHLLLGAYITNINQPTINPTIEEKITTSLLTGIAFLPSTGLTISTEIEKEILHPPTLRAGMEYYIFSKLAFRSGFSFKPQAGFAGLGFKHARMNLDYAIRIMDVFGMSHQATITCHLTKNQ
jgi:hypothetical protein